MVALLNAMNGKLITNTRYTQFAELCVVVGILPQMGFLNKASPWLAGFFDADGQVGIRRDASFSLSIGQEDTSVLTPLVALWGGNIHFGSATNVSL